jgi:triacylglycerol lipase
MRFLATLPRRHYDKTAFDDFTAERDFTLGNGKAMAWLSQLAYETDEPDKIEEVLRSWGLRLAAPVVIDAEFHELRIARSQCFVAVGRSAAFMALAGADPFTFASLITKVNASVEMTGTAKGYKRAAKAVWPQLRKVITATAFPNKKVFVTGHSLGGVLAVLLALRIERDHASEIGAVYTFGMPRPGSPAFADEYYNPALGPCTYRLVHASDLIPAVAPSGLGFRHVGRFLRCERGGKFDPSELAVDTKLDEPEFATAAVEQLSGFFEKPLSGPLAQLAQARLALVLAPGSGPTAMRDHIEPILIELLPPPIRDHMPDRYIGAF